MKAVLMSVHPEWCEKIKHIIGQIDTKPIYEKSVEIRKTRPKIETPFKCYIYCTRGYVPPDTDAFTKGWFGYVIGEFVCDEIFPIRVFENGTIQDYMWHRMERSCVPYDDISKYIGKDKTGYGWHISDLVIYDKPKELSEFQLCENIRCSAYLNRLCLNRMQNDVIQCKNLDCQHKKLTRPPQSWCYVEGKDVGK